jgi:hypothetical protein
VACAITAQIAVPPVDGTMPVSSSFPDAATTTVENQYSVGSISRRSVSRARRKWGSTRSMLALTST